MPSHQECTALPARRARSLQDHMALPARRGELQRCTQRCLLTMPSPQVHVVTGACAWVQGSQSTGHAKTACQVGPEPERQCWRPHRHELIGVLQPALPQHVLCLQTRQGVMPSHAIVYYGQAQKLLHLAKQVLSLLEERVLPGPPSIGNYMGSSAASAPPAIPGWVSCATRVTGWGAAGCRPDGQAPPAGM